SRRRARAREHHGEQPNHSAHALILSRLRDSCARRMPRFPLTFSCIAAVVALSAVAWAALWFVAQDLYRLRARIDRRDVAIPLALFVTALALRWFLPFHTLI